MTLSYRPEIDGMRAVAVVSVIVYHLKIPVGDGTLLPGGFLGVDLFFVLSGFLITQILLREIDGSGRVDLRKFYWRRARRILPPLLLVMLASLPAAWLVLLPSELETFAGSLVAALLFVSNGFWFIVQGSYGAQSALLEPFLHTWSLAIEEQFYLVFPPLLYIVARRRVTGPVLLAGVVLGFLVAAASTEWRPFLSFFSPASRAWELLAGAALAWATLRYPEALKGNMAARALPAIGLALIVMPIAVMHLSQVSHPGLATLPVVAGSCLLIWFADPREPVTRLLSSRAFVSTGLLSYSLYLWHYPIFAFGRHLAVTPSAVDMVVWVTLTFALSAAGYVLVEKPFRYAASPRVLVQSLTASAALVTVFFAATIANNGFPSRNEALATLYAENEFDNAVLRDESWELLDELAGEEDIGAWNAQEPSDHEAEALWFSPDDRLRVLLVGNSHSKDLFNAFHLNRGRFPEQQFARFTIGTPLPSEQVDLLLASPNFEAADVVLFVARYHDMPIEELPGVIDRILATGKPLLMVGSTAEFVPMGTLPFFDWYVRENRFAETLDGINTDAYDAENRDQARTDRFVEDLADEVGVPLISRRDLVCDDVDRTCILMTPSGRKTLYDNAHWTLDGARYFGMEAARTGWLEDGLAQVCDSEQSPATDIC